MKYFLHFLCIWIFTDLVFQKFIFNFGLASLGSSSKKRKILKLGGFEFILMKSDSNLVTKYAKGWWSEITPYCHIEQTFFRYDTRIPSNYQLDCNDLVWKVCVIPDHWNYRNNIFHILLYTLYYSFQSWCLVW